MATGTHERQASLFKMRGKREIVLPVVKCQLLDNNLSVNVNLGEGCKLFGQHVMYSVLIGNVS